MTLHTAVHLHISFSFHDCDMFMSSCLALVLKVCLIHYEFLDCECIVCVRDEITL